MLVPKIVPSFPPKLFAIWGISYIFLLFCGETLVLADIDASLLYVLAMSAVGVYGILLAGWASNNKYSLIGAMRSGAQIISYELSVGLSLLTIVVLTGSLQFSEILCNSFEFFCMIYRSCPVSSIS